MKTKLLLLLFLLAVSNGFAQSTSIPDTKFEAKLIALGIDDVADGQVLTSNINTLTQLNVSSSSISDLTGIQDFVGLTYLNCQSNNLISLDLSNNIKLTQLNCSYNKLTNLDLSKNKELYGFECMNNQLSNLDLSQNTKLAALKCNNNQLTTLNIKNGTNRGIYLLNFSNNKNLSCVIVDDVDYANPKWNNQVEAYPFFSSYDCSTITQIPNTQFEDKLIALGIDTDGKNGIVLNSSIQTLTVLDISNSSLTDVTGLEGFSSLTTLNCSSNLLNNINLSRNSALTTLDCSNNPTLTCIQVADIAFATNNWTTTKDALAKFNLDCNQYTLIPDTNFEAKLIALGIDNVADGKVLTSKVNKLLKLEIYNSSIKDLTGIQDFAALETLNFGNNQITNVDFSKNTALTSLICDKNQISVLDLSNNAALRYLNCSSNKLTSIDLSKNTTIFSLYCNNNQLTNLDLKLNTVLTYFECSQNQLTNLDISNCTKLNTLACNSNKIKTLDVSLNIELYELKVQDNQITTLNLSKNTALRTLNCSSNKLTNLNLKNGTNSQLSNVSFSINPDLSCITVDDVTYANTNWTEIKDAHCFYSSYDCSTVTVIPNELFEDKLIALGIDTDGKNGVVFNSSIQTLTALDLSNSSLTDVTGLEGFSALATLNVSNNSLKSLNLSKNKALTTLDCSNNASLTCIQVANVATATANWTTTKDAIANFGLDCRPYTLIPDTNFEARLIALKIDDIPDGRVLTNRISTIKDLQIIDSPITDLTGIQDFAALVNLLFINGQITSLDLSKNTQLETLNCSYNKLTILDLSKNTKLISLSCYGNELTNVNLKNGHNSSINSLNFTSNSNLSCIAVDDEAYANTNWSSFKDSSAFYSAYSCSEITAIPDPLFEDKLIALTIDTDGKNKYVLNSSIQTLTTLDVSNSSINKLTGIEAFTALTSLDCSTNKLQALDLNKNILLTDLNCNSNQLKELDISGNTALTKLNVSSNYLKTIDLSKNTSLTDLNCSSNSLSGLILSTNTSLTKLNVAINQLTTLDISKQTSLADFICNSNQLNTLNISKNTALTNLQISSNQLTTLDLSKNTALTNLNVSSNQLAGLDVSSNINLTELIVSNNSSLKNLNLKNGNNSKLSEATISFTNNPSLKCIQVDDKLNADTNWAAKKDVKASYSEDCNPFISIPDSNFEDKLIALGIDTDGKNGKVLLESVNTITTLDVSSGNIADLTGIQKFTALTALNCSSNKLTSLDISQNIALADFNCSTNNLTSLNCKNGNNTQLSVFDATKNPNLTCIQVDDAIYARTNWVKKDAVANFNTDCASSDLYTYIPDLNFENKLIELAIDTSPADGKVLTSNINTLTSLNISGAAITNLKGIEVFSALTNLDCSGNQLTTVDLSKNTALTDLNCSTNQLNSLDLSKNTVLTKLNASSNQLTALDLSKNTALTDVVLSTNQLTVLDISKNTVLANLNLNSNQLTGLNTSKNTALTALNLNSNQLTTLDISKNTALINLNCSSNQLAGLDASNNTNLEALAISNNLLLVSLNLQNGNNSKLSETTINFLQNPNLKCIQVDDKVFSDTNWASQKDATANYNEDCDPFTAIPDAKFEDKLIALGIDTDGKNGKVLIESINTITTLDVSSSSITDLTGIQKFTALTSLNCSSNQITNLDVSRNKLLVDLNCSSNNLTSLNCKNTNNSQMSSFNATNNPNLTCIQVDDVIYARTNWTEKKDAVANFNTDCATADLYTYIPDLNFENKLIELAIDSNLADGKVLTSNINTLTSLNVSYANIVNLKGIEAFSALTNLDCSANQLTTLDISKNTALTDLNCSINQLINLDINLSISLTRLNLVANKLTNLNLSKNTLLNQLNVSSNQLTSIDISQNVALTDFTCTSNKITSLDVSNNSELERIDCSNNELTALEIPKSDKLIALNCQGNKLSVFDINNVTNLNLLDVRSNQLTSLDITKDKALIQLYCSSNQLTYLNISENKELQYLDCSSNQLESLNLKNGNNTKFFSMHFENNPNLSCIKVDDKTYSDTNWSAYKDATASFDTECGLSLPVNNFIVQTKGESCLGENNGEINISATETFLYTASINGESHPFTNKTLSVTGLAPGNYTVSITIPGETFEQNFNIVIAKGATITGKSTVSSKKVNVAITDGTAPYTVFVNGIEQFETNDSNFSLTARGGGLLEVKTAKACEGVYTEDITGLDLVVSAYPNPTSGSFEIELPVADKEVTIEINALDGRVISSKKYSLENGTAQLTLENQPKGVYIAKIHLAEVKSVKIIKN